jgi:hypothetical protein
VKVDQLNKRIKNVLRELGINAHGPVVRRVDQTVIVDISWSGSNYYMPDKFPHERMLKQIAGALSSIGIPEKAVSRLNHHVPKGMLHFCFRTQLAVEEVEKIEWRYYGPAHKIELEEAA